MEIDPAKIVRMHDAFNAELDRQDEANISRNIDQRERDPKTEWIEGYYDINAALAAALKAIS